MQGSNIAGCTLLLIALASCGGGGKQEPSAPVPAPAPSAPSPATQPSVVPAPTTPPSNEPAKPDDGGIVHLSASDQMRFSTTRIEVKAGDKVKIEFKNMGTLPKEVMGHDLVVLKPGADVTAFAAKAMGAKATDYIPPDTGDQMIAHTRLLAPNESQTTRVRRARRHLPVSVHVPRPRRADERRARGRS